MMRATLSMRNQSLGEAVSALLRQSLSVPVPVTPVGGLPLMAVQPGAGYADVAVVVSQSLLRYNHFMFRT